MSSGPDPNSFLSGDAGDVTDPWRVAKRRAGELAYDALDIASGTRRRSGRLAALTRPLEVLVLGVYRPGSLLADALPALRSAHHGVECVLGSTEALPAPPLADLTAATGLAGGKFENLNALLAKAPRRRPDWTLVVDDDVVLPDGFLDRFLGICEAFALDLAQPAQTLRSHSAWNPAPARGARADHALRRDRPGHCLQARAGGGAAAVPRAALRLGT